MLGSSYAGVASSLPTEPCSLWSNREGNPRQHTMALVTHADSGQVRNNRRRQALLRMQILRGRDMSTLLDLRASSMLSSRPHPQGKGPQSLQSVSKLSQLQAASPHAPCIKQPPIPTRGQRASVSLASVNCNATQLAKPVLVPRGPGVHTAQEEGLQGRTPLGT